MGSAAEFGGLWAIRVEGVELSRAACAQDGLTATLKTKCETNLNLIEVRFFFLYLDVSRVRDC